MKTERNLIQYQKEDDNTAEKPVELKKTRQLKSERDKEVEFGIRSLLTYPISACEKIDKLFGSGGEAIVHYMSFESGYHLFDTMVKSNPGRELEELLKALIDAQPHGGWGHLSLGIVHNNPHTIDINVKNPPVKTLKGSQKHLIGSFWAGVLSRHFNRQLICKNFNYDVDRDEFSFTVTI